MHNKGFTMPATSSSSSRHQQPIDEYDSDDPNAAAEQARLTHYREDIRKRLRSILERVTKTKRSNLQSSSSGYQKVFTTILEEAREIFSNEIAASGDHVRELKLDAFIYNELSILMKSYFETLVQGGNKCDLSILVKAMKVKYHHDGDIEDVDSGRGTNRLSFDLLGRAVLTSLFNTSFPIKTMNGPIKQEVKVRNAPVRNRNVKEDMKGVKGQTAVIQENDGDEDQNDSTAARVKNLFGHVQTVLYEDDDDDDGKNQKKKRESDKMKKAHQLDMLHTLVDPKDTVKTIENFFDFAFLLKEKYVEERIDKTTRLPVVLPSNLSVAHNSTAPIEKRQFIVSLNMGELEELQSLLYSNPDDEIERHPLKREREISDLYECTTVGEQIEKIKKMKAAAGGKKGGEADELEDELEDPKVTKRRKSRK